MDTSSAGNTEGSPQGKPSLLSYLGLLPVLVCLALVIGLWLFPRSLVIFEPHYLLPAFNTTLFLAAGIIAFIACRTYLLSGSPTVLWMRLWRTDFGHERFGGGMAHNSLWT